MHQHQHQHMHQHQHQHYGSAYPLGGTPPSMKTPSLFGQSPAASLAELERERQKVNAAAGLPGAGLPGYPGLPGLSPMLPPPSGLPGASSLGSAGHLGAFQPKSVPGSLHHSQLLMSIRDREKAGAGASASNPNAPPALKKSGKWCAVHVRIAWEIYHHQQKQSSDGSKASDGSMKPELRPPPHFAPGGLSRPEMPDPLQSAYLVT